MIEVRQTAVFIKWHAELRDVTARKLIDLRLLRVAAGNLGDATSVGGAVGELRIGYGPGYRVYFTRRGDALIILLCGGDKGSQARDIRAARAMAEEV